MKHDVRWRSLNSTTLNCSQASVMTSSGVRLVCQQHSDRFRLTLRHSMKCSFKKRWFWSRQHWSGPILTLVEKQICCTYICSFNRFQFLTTIPWLVRFYLLGGVTRQGVSQVSAEGTLPHSSFSRKHQDLVFDCWQLLSYFCYSWRWSKRRGSI